MSMNEEILIIVGRMKELARRGGDEHVAQALEQVETLVQEDLNAAVKKIMTMYGGLGSLNDVVLYEGNRPLVAENVKFDQLRTDLYDLCLTVREG